MKTWSTLILLCAGICGIAQVAPETAPQKNAPFQNPLFAGDYPDPSILREGNDFYMVHSSFEYYPGLLIWHSRDLLHWQPVAHALHRNVGSVWAPDLVKYGDKYYIYFPANNTNYVVVANRIEGPWSDPKEIAISMIDPGHVADEKGNRYLYFSSGSYVPLTPDGLSVAGPVVACYTGWPIPKEWSMECFCMEGPKLIKRGNYYYLTVAQGGTAGPATGHMVISARSKSPLGPWENSPYNPVLRAQSDQEQWCSVGHGTLFDDANGNWYLLFHGYEKGHYNMGRQTLLTSVEWTPDGWFKTTGRADTPVALPGIQCAARDEQVWHDSFLAPELDLRWQLFGGYDSSRIHLDEKGLTLKGMGNSPANSFPLLRNPSSHNYTVQVEVHPTGNATGGLILYYNHQAYSGILAQNGHILCGLRGWQYESEKLVWNQKVTLQLRKRGNVVDMYYQTDGRLWQKIECSLEVSGWNHNSLGGFLSLRIGLCAIGEGAVTFKNFMLIPE